MIIHRSLARMYIVGKPEGVVGHSISGYRLGWYSHVQETGRLEPKLYLDAPAIFLYHHNDKWVVACHEYAGGPGPGDFYNEWDTTEEAVADVLDFYFGDPARMSIKQVAHAEFLKHLSSFKQEGST